MITGSTNLDGCFSHSKVCNLFFEISTQDMKKRVLQLDFDYFFFLTENWKVLCDFFLSSYNKEKKGEESNEKKVVDLDCESCL